MKLTKTKLRQMIIEELMAEGRYTQGVIPGNKVKHLEKPGLTGVVTTKGHSTDADGGKHPFVSVQWSDGTLEKHHPGVLLPA